MKNNAEVVIIGGGIIGCATAYYLAKEGVSVIVLEKSDHIGNGGSSRNGGGVRQSGRDPRELPLAMYAVEHMWPTLSEELGVDVEYHKEGNLRLGKTAKHKEILQGLTDRAVALGLDVRMIDGKEVREINPYLSEEITVASWCPTDGHAIRSLQPSVFTREPESLAQSLLQVRMCSRSRRSKEKPDV